jgi:hypothetical protein
MAIESKVWTYQLSSSTLTIDNTFGFTVVSLLVTNGTVLVTGGLRSGGIPSTGMTLVMGQGVSFSSGNNNNIILSDIYIDASAGTVVITGR